MMTIKEFAKLCQCSAQTLRYYDRIDLLRPARVDEMTGYRYYEKEQALNFVKIKNLQLADFSIEEIRPLLNADDEEIVKAFDQKILQQKEKLEQMMRIQKSYLEEKRKMIQAIERMSDFITSRMNEKKALIEFGFQPEDGEKIKQLVKDYLVMAMKKNQEKQGELHLKVNEEHYVGTDAVMEGLNKLTPEEIGDGSTILFGNEDAMENDPWTESESEVVYEKHGWDAVHQFIDEVPQLMPSEEYCFVFELNEEKSFSDVTFPMCMIASVIMRNKVQPTHLGCSVKTSEDGLNHFTMYHRKEK